MSEYCGVSIEHEEEGLCRRHTAERLGVSVSRVHSMIRFGELDAGRSDSYGAYLDCGVKKRGSQIVPLGQIMWIEDREDEEVRRQEDRVERTFEINERSGRV